MFSKRVWFAVAACTSLAGCTSLVQSRIGDEDPALGEAFRYDTAMQVINPAPVYGPDSTQPGSNGDKGAQAVKRYRTDKVKPVETMGTTSGVENGGGMSSGPQ